MAEKEFTILDTFFKIPIRIYNELEIKKIHDQEERDELAGIQFSPVDAPFVIGWTRLPYKMAKNISWSDYFSRSRTTEEVESEGFDCTYITSPDGDVYICAYERKKFEKMFLSYLESVEEYYTKLDEQHDKKIQNVEG